jgi:chorismate synthase
MAFVPEAQAFKKDKEKTELTAEQKQRVIEIEHRVEEIQAMDFSAMDKAERKKVKSELKAMKKEARDIGGGLYVSVGAIIIFSS